MSSRYWPSGLKTLGPKRATVLPHCCTVRSPRPEVALLAARTCCTMLTRGTRVLYRERSGVPSEQGGGAAGARGGRGAGGRGGAARGGRGSCGAASCVDFVMACTSKRIIGFSFRFVGFGTGDGYPVVSRNGAHRQLVELLARQLNLKIKTRYRAGIVARLNVRLVRARTQPAGH